MRRRDFLLALVAFASLGGCKLLPRHQESEVESLFAELDRLLAELPAGQRQELERLAGQLRFNTDQILEIHRKFLDSFNAAAASRETSSDQLQQMYSVYQGERARRRREILLLQDEMHAAAPAAFWPEIREVLNRHGGVVRSGRVGET